MEVAAPSESAARRSEKHQPKLAEELKAAQREQAAAERWAAHSDRERERTSAELLRALTRAEKLETLCRELQSQREAAADEARRVAVEEASKRQELTTKFSSMLEGIQSRLDEHDAERQRQQQGLEREAALAAEVSALRARVGAMVEGDGLRDKHHAMELRAKELELQLADARLRQADEHGAAVEASAAQAAEAAAAVELDLRTQLAAYGGQFGAFERTLSESTSQLAQLRVSTERGTKRVGQLERDNAQLRSELARLSEQKVRLEGLCRTLQGQLQEARKQSQAQSEAVRAAPPAVGDVVVRVTLKVTAST
jgi:predicted  nucleic acid-binding Zn-ribbon protein